MVMTYKSGVPSDTLSKEMWQLLNVIDVITLYTTKRFAIITSTTDGKHKKGSLHYLGLAVDLRTKDLTPIVNNIPCKCIRSVPLCPSSVIRKCLTLFLYFFPPAF